jgi:hypothetical protein
MLFASMLLAYTTYIDVASGFSHIVVSDGHLPSGPPLFFLSREARGMEVTEIPFSVTRWMKRSTAG